jgi:signal peptidase II
MKGKYVLFTAIAILVILVDQVSKLYVMRHLALHESIEVIPGFFNITYIRNPGAAFGFLSEAPPYFRYIFFVAVTVAAIVLILYYLRKSATAENTIIVSLALIFSGAVGNLIDRVRFGEVSDFLDVYIGSAHWPAFNAADSAITLGAAFLLVELFKRGRERRDARTYPQ